MISDPGTAARMRYIACRRKMDLIELECRDLDADGAAVGEAAGLRVHVAGAAPDERVRARLVHRSPHRPEAWAELVEVLVPSALRRAPACRAYGACGGCPLEHLDYAAQVAWKGRRVAEALAGLGVPVEPCVPSPRPLGYRNRSKLVYGLVDGRPALGAWAPRSHVLVDLAGCRVAEPPLDETAEALRQIAAAAALAPYDEASGSGLMRYAILRVNFRGQVLVTLVTARRAWPEGAALARALGAARPEVIGVVQNVNPSRGNALYGDEQQLLDGASALDEQVGDVRLRLSATAFFQVNRAIAERLYADARTAAGLAGHERVVDCYAGVGGLALTLAPDAREVIGSEEHPAAVADACAAAALAGVERARFVCGDAAAQLSAVERADVVVVNPPRRGCAPAVLDEIARLGARRVLYVSCAPDTLARDLARLGRHGYRTVLCRPYDMLPQTPHVEALAVVEKH
jgi:23S rRNA (uracil1939-C5)-methyltransferase